MKALTLNGRKMLNKICFNCKQFRYKVAMYNGKLIGKEITGFCFKTKKDTDKYNTCKEFEFE